MTKLTIIVSGRIAAAAQQGGATWAVLQYLLGFRRLGHDVYFVEELPPHPNDVSSGAAAQRCYFEQTMRDFGFADRAALLQSGAGQSAGLSYARLRHIARSADVVVNLSGTLRDPELLAPVPARVYLDLDPGFTQVWHEQGIDVGLAGHTHFVTVGLSVGQGDCPVPTCGRQWLTTVQPVVLDSWPVSRDITWDAFTSVANWRGYGSIEHCGVSYGQKAHSVRELMDLPRLMPESPLLALAIDPGEGKDLAALRTNGWRLIDPGHVAGGPAAYRQFVQGSKAELGIAKKGYVAARTGWFSDRSMCYLASGRPVVAQDTGFSHHLPAGEGLLAFSTTGEALSAVATVNADYPRHARAARAIAEELADSDTVLARLLQTVGAS